MSGDNLDALRALDAQLAAIETNVVTKGHVDPEPVQAVVATVALLQNQAIKRAAAHQESATYWSQLKQTISGVVSQSLDGTDRLFNKFVVTPPFMKQQKKENLMQLIEHNMGIKDPTMLAAIAAGIDQTEDLRHFNRAEAVLKLLVEYEVTGDKAVEFFKGGHFIVEDQGALFTTMKYIDGMETRYSSHFKDTKVSEYGICCGRILPEVLFLDTLQDGNKRSHFQAEASPWRGVTGMFSNLQTMEHIPDTFTYGCNKLKQNVQGRGAHNLGPYGWSQHDDANPVLLNIEIAPTPSPHRRPNP